MDVLTDVLNTLELKGWLSSRRELVPPWRYDFAASKDSMFHRWRMLRATRLLKNEVKMETIAELLGYKSEVAFRKAFKREIGIPPAQYRKRG